MKSMLNNVSAKLVVFSVLIVVVSDSLVAILILDIVSVSQVDKISTKANVAILSAIV